jgi:hypothetical protein
MFVAENGEGNGNGKNGKSIWSIVSGVLTVLIAAGIVGLIVTTIQLTARIATLETLAGSYERRLAKIENDIYAPRFADKASPTKNGRVAQSGENGNPVP